MTSQAFEALDPLALIDRVISMMKLARTGNSIRACARCGKRGGALIR
jgi:hypothetical protein